MCHILENRFQKDIAKENDIRICNPPPIAAIFSMVSLTPEIAPIAKVAEGVKW
jgi:hypothetical protein